MITCRVIVGVVIYLRYYYRRLITVVLHTFLNCWLSFLVLFTICSVFVFFIHYQVIPFDSVDAFRWLVIVLCGGVVLTFRWRFGMLLVIPLFYGGDLGLIRIVYCAFWFLPDVTILLSILHHHVVDFVDAVPAFIHCCNFDPCLGHCSVLGNFLIPYHYFRWPTCYIPLFILGEIRNDAGIPLLLSVDCAIVEYREYLHLW